jgi:hypothetical protein
VGGISRVRAILSRKLVAISKPRCGSTSVRRMLDRFVDPAKGDIAVDRAGTVPGLHPHITAPALRQVLAERGVDLAGVTFIVTIRHPVHLLWSYYKHFRPDAESRYSFSDHWAGSIGMSFEDWILRGRLYTNPEWAALAPAWISARDLSTLSLEYRAMTRDGALAVDKVFELERLDDMAAWLAGYLGAKVRSRHVNTSTAGPPPPLGTVCLERVRAMFPYEAAHYGV